VVPGECGDGGGVIRLDAPGWTPKPRVRPPEFDIVTDLGHIRELIDHPESSTFPIGSSGAGEDLRRAMADKSGYHSPKLTRVRCARSWCNTDRIAMWMVVVAQNGVRQAQLRCIACCAIDKTIGADKIGVEWPVIRNYAERSPDCDRCGSSDGTELHHWAPRHLFEDAHQWPTSYLCRSCHTQWHSTVTPNMNRRRAA